MKLPLSSALAFCVIFLAAGTSTAQPVQPAYKIRGMVAERGAVDLPVQFEYNSAQLTPQAVAQLKELAQALIDPSLASNRFRIEGHTDSDGSAAYNQVLSERRAEAAKRFLVGHGVAAARLQAIGFGASRPIPDVDESTEQGKALNRRVTAVDLGKMPNATTAKEKPAADATPHLATQDAAETKPKQPPASKLHVDVVVQYERNGQKEQVRPGIVLRPVDNYNVSFTPTTRTFVYVLQFDSQGNASIVFPNKDYSATVNPVVAQKSYVVPSDGRWLHLKETPGDEEIVVLASSDEIDDPLGVAQVLRKGPKGRGVEPYPVKDEPIVMPADLFSYRLPYKTQLPP